MSSGTISLCGLELFQNSKNGTESKICYVNCFCREDYYVDIGYQDTWNSATFFGTNWRRKILAVFSALFIGIVLA